MGAAYPKLNAGHGSRLPNLDKGRAVCGAYRIDAYCGGPGSSQGAAIGAQIGADEFGIILLWVQLFECLRLQLIA